MGQFLDGAGVAALWGILKNRIQNISNEHLWAKSHYAEVLTEQKNAIVCGGNWYATTEFLYSDEIRVDPHTGGIMLVNAQSVLAPNADSVIKGKYVAYEANVVDGIANSVDKIPADAQITIFYGSSANRWDIDKKYVVSSAIEVVGYVNDAEANAYPVDDDFMYTYLGRIGGKTGFDVLSDTDVLNALLGVD